MLKIYICFRGALPRTTLGKLTVLPQDPLAEFAAGSHDRELSRVETRHTHITAAKYSLPTGQPVAWFAIGDMTEHS